MPDLPRRRLLAGAGTALAGALAGCSSSTDDEPAESETEADVETDGGSELDGGGSDEGADAGASETDADGEDGTENEADDADDGTVLGEISIENVHDRSHTVDIIVEIDGEVEHWTTHELEAGGGATLERDWPTDPGSFRLLARLDGTELTQVEPEKWNEPACLNLVAMVDRDGKLTMLSDTGGGPCGTGDAEFDADANESDSDGDGE